MADPTPLAQTLGSLHRKRGNKRGMLTRLQRKVSELLDKHPDEVSNYAADDLLKDLDSLRLAHRGIQDQIDDLVQDNEDYEESEETEKDRDDDSYEKVKTTIKDFQQFHELWINSNGLSNELTTAQNVLAVDSPLFRESFVKLSTRCNDWFKIAQRFTRGNHILDNRFKDLEDRLAILTRDVHSSCRDDPTTPTTTTPADSSPSSARSSSYNNSSLHLDVPIFEGDPFKWANFETMFKATVSARAKGHSNLEIKGHLIKAVKHPEGQKIFHSIPDPDSYLDSMLDLLREKFGSPQVLCPLIIAKIQKMKHLRLTAADMASARDDFILPFQTFHALVGDSLSSYLAMVFVGLMDPDCKREWLRHKEPDSVPDMDTVSKFVRYWQRELQSDCSPHVSASLTAPPPYTHSSGHHPIKQKTHTKPGNNKKFQNCPACNESHGLLRCPAFQNMDVDERNKLVRDKRLCINCFSGLHGYRNCPSKFSCKTCGAKHHTMLHIED